MKNRSEYDDYPDKEIFSLIEAEANRQRDGLELIPSENYVSKEVLAAMGSVFTNKYSEGYPGHRYYGGQEYTDKIESIAIDRAKAIFHADHANVQPHSGAQSNNAVYNAWLDPGDTVLGLSLDYGGHLTHGSPVTQSAKIYRFINYTVDPATGAFNYDEIEQLAKENHPKILLVGYSAYLRIPDFDRLAAIGHRYGCLLMADMAHVAGLIASGVHPNPLDHGFEVMTTTTHKTLRGPRGGMILSKGIASNPLKKVPRTIENIPTLIDRSVFPGTQGGPLMHIIAAKAVALYEAMQPDFRVYAKQIIRNAKCMAEEFRSRDYVLVGGGTDNHLILINMIKSRQINGAVTEAILDKIGITANKNVIPADPEPAFRPSGLRLGTPAITTRGLKEPEIKRLVELIDQAMANRDDEHKLTQLHEEVVSLAKQFPLPSDK